MEKIMKINTSVKKQLVVIFSVMLVAVISVVIAVSTIMNSRYITQTAEEDLHRIVDNVNNTIKLYFEERKLQLQSVANNSTVKQYLKSGDGKEIVRQLLSSQFQTYQKFENFFITDTKGFIVLDGDQGKGIGLDIKVFPFWALSTNNNEFHIDDIVYRSPLTNLLVTVTAVPIRDGDQFLGLLCLPINWETFSKNYIDTVKIGHTGYVTIMDTKYTIVAHPNKKLILKGEEYLLKNTTTAGFIQTIKDLKTGFQRYNFSGKWKYMSFDVSEVTGFTIIGIVEENEFLAGVKLTRNITIGIGLIALLLGLVVVYLFSNSIIRPIKMITEGAERFSTGDIELEGMDVSMIEKINKRQDELGTTGRAFSQLIAYMKEKAAVVSDIAKGDLTVQVPITSEDDQLGQSLHTMVKKLSGLVNEIRTSSNSVATGAEQLAVTSQSMSSGATEQAASVEEISSSMTEISAQVKQNAENGEQANSLALETRQAAEKGNDQMTQMVSSMNDITQSSQNMSKIIKVIDEIAFQINLLALNAAVEAARAGKYGKGFAVVAEEVRNLAARSGNAANEITEMIETSVKQVESGTDIAGRTAEALEAIDSSITKITDLVGEIAAASKEQALGVNQITQGLDQIDSVTQQNSAHAEESASAAEELSGQATQLTDHINIFKVAQEQNQVSPMPEKQREIQPLSAPLSKVKVQVKSDKNSEEGQTDWGSEVMQKQIAKVPVNVAAAKIQLDDAEFGKY